MAEIFFLIGLQSHPPSHQHETLASDNRNASYTTQNSDNL
jgi:hypothetical protein